LWMLTLTTTTLGVVAFALIARLISTSQMGLLAILSLILSLAQLIAPLALPNAITRFVAEELAQGRRPNAADVLYQSTVISVALAAIMTVACFLFSSQISAALSVEPVVFQLLAVDHNWASANSRLQSRRESREEDRFSAEGYTASPNP